MAQQWLEQWRNRLIGGVLLGLLSCSPGSTLAENTRPLRRPKAWIDATSVCIFPLSSGALPTCRQELITSLSGAWEHALTVPNRDRLVAIEGGRYPAVDSVKIDLSDATLHPKPGKPQKIVPNNRAEHKLGVGDFHLSGTPLICEKAKLNFDITAANVRLDMEHDRAGHPILLLAEARQAVLRFDALPQDMAEVLLAAARESASDYGLKIDSAELHFESPTPRSISVDLHLRTRLGFIPAGMRFHARVDVDDTMNAKLTDLSCSGDEVLGPLIVGLLRPGLAKYEGKTRALISFPADMHLRDVQLKVDDQVHLVASFGS